MTASIRAGLPPLPASMAHLPVNRAGYPVPWFVAWIDGEPEFRVASEEKLVDALEFGLCWVCGRRKGRWSTFVIGPMCAVNRTSAEPPCHRECARYSAAACPWLSTPRMVRRDRHMPEDYVPAPGQPILRNPGVALLWTCLDWRVFRPPAGGILVEIGDPADVEWIAEGRPASRAEVLASIESGLPALAEIAGTDPDPGGALADLDARAVAARALAPIEGAS